MTSAATAVPGLSDAEHSLQLRRAVVASTVGTVIEADDFLLYVLVAPLVFAKLYFPDSDPLVGTLQAFGIYAVGFIARPVGAALFGHYGDRIGRKVTLISTLLLTGLSTFAVGFVPGYESIGIWGAIILTARQLWLSGAGMSSVGAFAPLGASVFGCDVSYAQLCAFPAVAGSFQTRCWRKRDSNSWSPAKVSYV